MDCVFCKIVKGEIPCYKIGENDKFLAFLDINPVSQGHSLVIPKKHSRWVWDMDESELRELGPFLARVAKALKKALNAKLILSVIWGEEVEHAHIHLIPLYENQRADELLSFSTRKPLENGEELAEKIRGVFDELS